MADPLDPDSDDDGLGDGFEVQYGLDPLDPSDAALDNDADGLSNLQEHDLETDPTNPDTDGDGASDGVEVMLGTDPLDPNSHPPLPGVPLLGPGPLLLLPLALWVGALLATFGRRGRSPGING